jgi:hypothetical protein
MNNHKKEGNAMIRKKRVHTASERIIILKENLLERVPVSKL